MTKRVFFIALLIFNFTMLKTYSQAVITVKADGTKAHTTITAAIAAADAGDTIMVYGTITEKVGNHDGSGILVNKDVIIKGEGIDATIIQADVFYNATISNRVFKTENANVEFRNLTIKHGNVNQGNGGAIYASGGQLKVYQCKIEKNISKQFSGGIATQSLEKLTIENCIFSENQGNTTANSGGAVYFNNSDTIIVKKCLFKSNSGIAGSGISIASPPEVTECTIENSTFSGNSSDAIFALVLSNQDFNAKITNCTFYANNRGLKIDNAGRVNLDIINNIFENNTNTYFHINKDAGVSAITRRNTICDDAEMAGLNGGTNGNQDNTDALLEALADNGGITETHAIPETSPAVDAGYAIDVPVIDQRNYGRPGTPDIGAFEYNGKPLISFDNVYFHVAGGWLLNTTAQMEYCVDGETWEVCTDDTTKNVVFRAGDVKLRQNDYKIHEVILVHLTTPTAPEVSINYENETTSSISATIEHSLQRTFDAPVGGGDSAVNVVLNDSIFFRYKATQTSLPSEVFRLDIPARPKLTTTVVDSTDVTPISANLTINSTVGLEPSDFSVTNCYISALNGTQISIEPTQADTLKIYLPANSIDAGNFVSDTLKVIYYNPVSVSEIPSNLIVFTDKFNYLHVKNAKPNSSLSLYNLNGQVVFSTKLKSSNYIHYLNLNEGIYLIRIKENKTEYSSKLFIR